MFQRLATLAVQRPKEVLLATLLAVVASLILGFPVANSMQPAGFDDPATDSVAARNQIIAATHANPDQILIAVVHTGRPVASTTSRDAVNQVVAVLKREPLVAQTLTAYSTRSPLFTSKDGKSTLVVAEFRNTSDLAIENAAGRLKGALAADHQVVVGGSAVANQQVNDIIRSDLVRAELLAFPVIFVLLLVIFRGLNASGMPVLVCAIAIAVTLLALRAVNAVLPLSVFSLDLVIGLGLGLAVDYCLLMLSRYREELARGTPTDTAIRQTLGTAGRTVFFSSVTVAAALASLLVFPQRFLYSMGLGGMVVTLVDAAAALIVLPAILRLLGPRLNAFTPQRWQQVPVPSTSGTWYHLAQFVMRHAPVVAVVTIVVLGAVGSPFLRIKLTSVDASVLPTSTSARQANDLLMQRFDANALQPIYASVTAPNTPAGRAAVRTLAGRFRAIPKVALVEPPQPLGGGIWRIDVVSSGSDFSSVSQDIVSRMRATSSSLPFLVGGVTPQFVDYKASVVRHLPISLAIIFLVIFIVLFLVTGSVVLPVKSFIMNLVTLSATFGILVLIFQDGRFEGLLGYTSQGAIESSQPVILFALVFGLSTDYGVFLLSRIREALDGGVSNEEAVAAGIERTGRIVTSAALLFCVAMAAFATSQIVFIKMLGIGTALAVLIDASVVRAFLVPSLMKLLGSRNWWAPAFLLPIRNYVKIEEADYIDITPAKPAAVPVPAVVPSGPSMVEPRVDQTVVLRPQSDQTIVSRRPLVQPAFTLAVVAGRDRGQVFPVVPRMTIGRDAANTVVLSDPLVSMQHARIDREGEQYVMYDLKSRNGVWVDGAPRSQYVLRDGDLIGLGNTLMRCKQTVLASPAQVR